MQVHIHDHLTVPGFTSIPEVGSAIYWAGKILSNLHGIDKYVVPSRALAEIIWERVRIVPTPATAATASLSYAIDSEGILALKRWTRLYLDRLSEKHQADGRHMVAAIDKLISAVVNPPAPTHPFRNMALRG